MSSFCCIKYFRFYLKSFQVNINKEYIPKLKFSKFKSPEILLTNYQAYIPIYHPYLSVLVWYISFYSINLSHPKCQRKRSHYRDLIRSLWTLSLIHLKFRIRVLRYYTNVNTNTRTLTSLRVNPIVWYWVRIGCLSTLIDKSYITISDLRWDPKFLEMSRC